MNIDTKVLTTLTGAGVCDPQQYIPAATHYTVFFVSKYTFFKLEVHPHVTMHCVDFFQHIGRTV